MSKQMLKKYITDMNAMEATIATKIVLPKYSGWNPKISLSMSTMTTARTDAIIRYTDALLNHQRIPFLTSPAGFISGYITQNAIHATQRPTPIM